MRDVEKFNSIALSAINDFIFAFGFPFTDTCTIYKTLSIDSVAFWEYTVKAEITQSYHAILWLSTSFFTFQMTLFSSSLYSIIFFPNSNLAMLLCDSRRMAFQKSWGQKQKHFINVWRTIKMWNKTTVSQTNGWFRPLCTVSFRNNFSNFFSDQFHGIFLLSLSFIYFNPNFMVKSTMTDNAIELNWNHREST